MSIEIYNSAQYKITNWSFLHWIVCNIENCFVSIKLVIIMLNTANVAWMHYFNQVENFKQCHFIENMLKNIMFWIVFDELIIDAIVNIFGGLLPQFKMN